MARVVPGALSWAKLVRDGASAVRTTKYAKQMKAAQPHIATEKLGDRKMRWKG
jgi:hypothetical protein